MARRRRRNYAKNMAIAGGAIGLLSGFNQGLADRRKQKAQAFALRYKELQNESERGFKTEERIAGQDFKTGLEASRVQSNIDLAEAKNRNAISLFEKGREFDWNDPDLEKDYSNVAEAFAAKDPTMLEIREDAGKAEQSSKWKDTITYYKASPELQKAFERVNKIGQSEGGVSVAKQSEYVTSQLSNFNKLGRRDKSQFLEGVGLNKALIGKERSDELSAYFADEVRGIDKLFQPPAKPTGEIGLFGGASANTPGNNSFESNVDLLMQQAREAIANNKDPAAVRQTLRDNGVSEELIGTL